MPSDYVPRKAWTDSESRRTQCYVKVNPALAAGLSKSLARVVVVMMMAVMMMSIRKGRS